MDNQGGWIKVYQSIREHWLWERPLYLKWWVDLLMIAEWRDRDRLIWGKIVTVRRGQIAVSISSLRERWRYRRDMGQEKSSVVMPQKKTILRFLRLLEVDGMIKRESGALPMRLTLITILNYDLYQSNFGTMSASVRPQYGDIKYTYSTPSSADSAREERPQTEGKEQWRAELERSQTFWEQAAMSLKCPIDWLRQQLPAFHSESMACQLREISFTDYRRDFFNYARRENQNRLRNANKNQSNTNNGGRAGGGSASCAGYGLKE